MLLRACRQRAEPNKRCYMNDDVVELRTCPLCREPIAPEDRVVVIGGGQEAHERCVVAEAAPHNPESY